MNIRKVVLLTSLSLSISATAQEKMVSIPESQLTEQQKSEISKTNIKNNIESAHGWVGLGKEVGEAVNSSLGAVTTQADNFSRTGVGRLTVALVVWKVLGDQAVHFIGALIELLVFLPFFIWSYRKTCMTRRVVTALEGFFGKKTWQVVPYETEGDLSPREGHTIVLAVFAIVWLITFFSY